MEQPDSFLRRRKKIPITFIFRTLFCSGMGPRICDLLAVLSLAVGHSSLASSGEGSKEKLDVLHWHVSVVLGRDSILLGSMIATRLGSACKLLLSHQLDS